MSRFAALTAKTSKAYNAIDSRIKKSTQARRGNFFAGRPSKPGTPPKNYHDAKNVISGDMHMIRSRIVWIVTIAAFLISTLDLLRARPQSPTATTVVLDGGTLIDGTGKNPINNAVVVVEGGRIKAVGSRGQVPIPANATVIKTDGRTILPGLIDGHIHLGNTPAGNPLMPQMFLRYGVTTVGDTNNQTDWVILQREGFNSGKFKGPRMFVSGIAIDGPTSVTNLQAQTVVYSAKTPEEARAYVRSLKAKGVDMVKTNYTLTFDQVAAVLDEARKAGIPVVGHTRNMRKAAELGHKYMEHMNTVAWALLDDDMGYERWQREGFTPERRMDTSKFPQLVEYMVKQGVYINPTLFANFRTASPRAQEAANTAKEILKDPVLGAAVPAATQRLWTEAGGRAPDPEGYKKVQEFLRQYVNAGGKLIAASDDTGALLPGLSLHYEMQMITDAGISPMKAIQGATLWGAEAIGQGKNYGSIEVGKVADFTIIEGDPLKDIATTRNVKMVIKDGRVINTAYDTKSVTPLPRPFGSFPQVSNLNPPVTRQGAQSVTLQVEGSKFNSKTVVRFDNTDLPTQFVSDTKLTATIDSRLLQNPGSYSVYVVNPGPGGSPSNAVFLYVDSK